MVYLSRDEHVKNTYKLLYETADGELLLLVCIESDSLHDLIEDYQTYISIRRWLEPGELVPVKVTITTDWEKKTRLRHKSTKGKES